MHELTAILARRSIRAYTTRTVDPEQIEDLLRAAMSAPSAGNERPWHFIVIRDRQLMETIPDIHPYSKMLREAPAAILVCGDPTLEKYHGYWVQDCAAATENILVAATALGLGSVWLGVYPEQDRMVGLRKLLGIPEYIIPFAIIPVGYPDEQKEMVDRYEAERVHTERW